MVVSSLKMTTTQIVKMSVTNSSLSEDYSNSDDHTKKQPDILLMKL